MLGLGIILAALAVYVACGYAFARILIDRWGFSPGRNRKEGD